MAEEIERYCRKNGVALAGKIKYDTAIIEAMVNKKTVIEYSDGEVSQQIRNIWEVIQNGLN